MSSEITPSPSPSSLTGFMSNSLIPLVWKVGSVVTGLVAIVAGLLYAKQESLLYFPEIGGGTIPRRPSQNPRGYRSPQERNIPFENCRIPCADGVYIHAWLLLFQQQQQQAQSKASTTPTILFFHGNAGNIGLRLPNAQRLMQATRSNILLVEYRGYGDSDSVSPSEKGLKLDAQAALHYAWEHPIIKKGPIFLFGRSLGGSVAFSLALYAQQQQQQQQQLLKNNNKQTPRPPLAGIMVENTFTSIPDMVDHLMPWLAPLKWLVLRMSWDSTKIIPELSSNLPMLFLAGAADELVPPSHMSKLVQLATTTTSTSTTIPTKNANNINNDRVSLHVIPGGTHNECWIQGGQPYWNAFAKFVHENSGAGTASSYSPPPFSAALSSSSPEDKAAAAAAADVIAAVAFASPNNVHDDNHVAEGSAIPTMSTRFVDMVHRREAAPASTTTTTTTTTTTDSATTSRQSKKDI